MRKDLSLAQFEKIAERGKKGALKTCLWKDGFESDSFESAWRFVTEKCYTQDDAMKEERLLPDWPHLQFLTYKWYEARTNSETLLIEKPRRIVVSWLLAALDVYDSGLRKGGFYIAAQTDNRAMEMVWRRLFIYDKIRVNNPLWSLPMAKYTTDGGSTKVRSVELPNGSTFGAISGGDPDAFRQEGASRVLCEEFAFWRYPDEAMSNAQHMVQGSKGMKGGHVIGVTTASDSVAYLEMMRPREGQKIPEPDWGFFKKIMQERRRQVA